MGGFLNGTRFNACCDLDSGDRVIGMAPADVLNTMLNLNTAYKAQTMATLVEGAVGVLVVYGLSIYML